MNLRDLTQAAAILAWHGLHPGMAADSRPGDQKEFWNWATYLEHLWRKQAQRPTPPFHDNREAALAEEILTAQTFIRISAAGFSVRTRGITRSEENSHLLSNHADAVLGLLLAIRAANPNQSTDLANDRLQRRMERWSDRLLSQCRPNADLSGYAANLARFRDFDVSEPLDQSLLPLTLAAIAHATPNRLVLDKVRTAVLRRMVQLSIPCIPEDAFQTDGPAKSQLMRMLQSGDSLDRTMINRTSREDWLSLL